MDEVIKALLEQNNRLIELVQKTVERALPDYATVQTPAPAPAPAPDFTDWTDSYLPPQQYADDNRLLIVDDDVIPADPNTLEDEII